MFRQFTGWRPLFTREVEVTFRASGGGIHSEITKRIKLGEQIEIYFPEISGNEAVKVAFLPEDEHGSQRITARSMYFVPTSVDIDDKIKSIQIFLLEDRVVQLGGGVTTRSYGDQLRDNWNHYNVYYGGSGTTTDFYYDNTTRTGCNSIGAATTNTVHYDSSTSGNWR